MVYTFFNQVHRKVLKSICSLEKSLKLILFSHFCIIYRKMLTELNTNDVHKDYRQSINNVISNVQGLFSFWEPSSNTHLIFRGTFFSTKIHVSQSFCT